MARLLPLHMLLLSCSACLWARAASAGDAPSRTDVRGLPGVGLLEAGGLKAAAGYLRAGAPPAGTGAMYVHYVCFADAEVWDDAEKPVTFWYNGGPGASSLFGLMQEFGPLLLTVDAYNPNGTMTPVRNPHAWTKHSVVCALDSPPPIGLSFCTDAGPGGAPTSCGPWRDTAVFAANRRAYDAFFRDAFPEWKGRTLYLAGESYAGIYVPGFAKAVMDKPIDGVTFGGFFVGDGFTGCAPQEGKPADYCVDFKNIGLFRYPNAMPGPMYDIQFFSGHSQMSEELHRSLMATCSEGEQRGSAPIQQPCLDLLAEMQRQVGYFYPYNLYDACARWMPNATLGHADRHRFHGDKHGMHAALRRRRTARAAASPGDGDGGVGSPCLGNALADWFLQNETLAALGVLPGSAFINCDNGECFDYTTDQPSVGNIYLEALSRGLRVVVYEGDSDACGLQTAPVEDFFVSLFGNAGIKQTSPWRPWTLGGGDDVQAGYRIEWLGGNATFASIRGSGHLAPLNRPHASEVLFQSFVNGSPLPTLTTIGVDEA